MAGDVRALYSAAARSGPPLFFPNPEVPVSFNFDQGLAAPETFPREELLRLAKEVLERDGADALEYFDAATGYEELVFGYRGLREQLAARYLREDGRAIDPMGIILTSGSVQAITLAINGYLDRGDVAIVEAASFPYALRFMEMAGAELRTVSVDGDGLDVEALERLLAELRAQGRRVKLVYTIATFQLPIGAELSLPRRRRLLELADQHDFMVLEDNVYGELRFAGERIPSPLSLDTAGRVLQCNAFSKTVAPGLRLGWMAGTPEAIGALAGVRQDLGVSQWLSRLMGLPGRGAVRAARGTRLRGLQRQVRGGRARGARALRRLRALPRAARLVLPVARDRRTRGPGARGWAGRAGGHLLPPPGSASWARATAGSTCASPTAT